MQKQDLGLVISRIAVDSAGADSYALRHFGSGRFGVLILRQMRHRSFARHLGVLMSQRIAAICFCAGCAILGCLSNPT